jgi:signal transduction histidine kinase
MVKLLLTGLFFLTFFAAFASEPERIKILVKNLPETSGEERKSILKELIFYYYDTIAEKTIEYATEYLVLIKDDQKATALTFFLLGKAYHNQINYKESLTYHLKSFEIYKILGVEDSILFAQFYVGNAYLNLNDYQKALEYTLPLIEIHKKNSKPRLMTSSMIQAGKCYLEMDENEKAIQVFEEAEQNSIAEKYTDFVAWCRYNLGVANFKLGNFKVAEDIHSENIKLYNSLKDVFGSLGSKQKLGDIYLLSGKFGKAYDLFFDAYENRAYLFGTAGENHFIGTNFENLGKIFIQAGNYNQALDYFDRGIKIAEEYNFDELKSQILYSKGLCYFLLDSLDKASSYFYDAMRFPDKSGNRFEIAKTINSLAEIELRKSNFDTAIRKFKEALRINQQIGNKFGESQNHLNLATCFLKTRKIELAKTHLDQGFVLAQRIGVDALLLGFYHLFTDYYNQSGNAVEAGKYLDLYVPLSEKINEDNKMELTRLLLRYYKNQTETNTKVLQQENELSKLESEKSRYKSNQYLLLLAITLITLIAGITRYSRKARAARKLEILVGERTRELTKSEEKLREVNATKERFFSIIAHDLKSPFTSLIGFADLLHNEYDEFSEEQRKEFIEIIRNSSEEIFTLLENLLEWTLSSTNQIQFFPENTDLYQVTEQAISLLEKNADKKNINIQNQVQKNMLVFADENMMRTVVRNLLSNAIKFTGNGGEIKIETIRENGSVEFAITDTGIGISKENLENLFDISTQSTQNGTANEHGTGLGLLLCKEFLAKNGSEINVESELNRGTKFSFTLPAIQNS